MIETLLVTLWAAVSDFIGWLSRRQSNAWKDLPKAPTIEAPLSVSDYDVAREAKSVDRARRRAARDEARRVPV